MGKGSRSRFRERLHNLGYPSYRHYLASEHWADVKLDRRKLYRQRDAAAVDLVEIAAAVSLIDHHGLHAELRDGAPFVEVDHQCVHAAAPSAPAEPATEGE